MTFDTPGCWRQWSNPQAVPPPPLPCTLTSSHLHFCRLVHKYIHSYILLVVYIFVNKLRKLTPFFGNLIYRTDIRLCFFQLFSFTPPLKWLCFFYVLFSIVSSFSLDYSFLYVIIPLFFWLATSFSAFRSFLYIPRSSLCDWIPYLNPFSHSVPFISYFFQGL